MTDIEQQIEELTKQLQQLRGRQMQMNAELVLAEQKLQTLKMVVSSYSEVEPAAKNEMAPEAVHTKIEQPYILKAKAKIDEKKAVQKKPSAISHELEDFIGTNVISKVGILITIIGVFIGAKYAIDNELISPFMRILAGYFAAAVLAFIAIRLKKKYEYFSSILIGGGLSVTYFITYIAYSFYALFPLVVAFALMMMATVAAVGIALWYNQKVIALLGQVAAYAIPFLLGNGHGNIFVLFGYITVINFGLLILSFKKNWKLLYRIAFFLTWLIYGLSAVSTDKVTSYFAAGLTFLAVNFLTFYVTFLSYKTYKKELYRLGEIAILLLNALFFFFIGTYLINENFTNIHFLTWFTIANASLHLAVGFGIYKLHLADQSVFQFILGLGLLFITIAIPIEFNGNWVTILWTVEATALAYVANNTSRNLYLEIAMPLVVISLISLLQDWYVNYPFISKSLLLPTSINKTPFVNINFILSLFVCGCIGLISSLTRNFIAVGKSFIAIFFTTILPVAFLAILYLTFFNEIRLAWDKAITINHNKANPLFQSLSLILYSCLYVAVWFIINTRFIKNKHFQHLLLLLALIVNVTFIFKGLYLIGELRELYMARVGNASISLLAARYFCFGALATLWLAAFNRFKFLKPAEFWQNRISNVFNITLLCIISNEFIHWMDLAGYQNQYKLGLSLIGGCYALLLLFKGIVRNKKHLRISAIVLFTCTLLKLFFYDLSSLSTISKTIVLVILGILLLSASFLYNKYKGLLFVKDETVE